MGMRGCQSHSRCKKIKFNKNKKNNFVSISRKPSTALQTVEDTGKDSTHGEECQDHCIDGGDHARMRHGTGRDMAGRRRCRRRHPELHADPAGGLPGMGAVLSAWLRAGVQSLAVLVPPLLLIPGL
jgi:hypothetical protein